MTSAVLFRRVLRNCRRPAWVAATAWLLGWSGSRLEAQTTIYSDVTTFSGSAFANGGATSATGNTYIVADDIAFSVGSVGQLVNSVRFSVANLNAAAVSARPTLVIYAANGTSSGPGTLLASVAFNAISFTASTVNTFTYAPGSTIFTVPTGNTVWAGLYFNSTTATQAQLNNLGQGLFNPPTVGTSQDLFFLSSAPAVSGASSPAGGNTNFGGSPVANFGWVFAAVPEPSTWAMLGVGAVGAGVVVLRRRRVLA